MYYYHHYCAFSALPYLYRIQGPHKSFNNCDVPTEGCLPQHNNMIVRAEEECSSPPIKKGARSQMEYVLRSVGVKATTERPSIPSTPAVTGLVPSPRCLAAHLREVLSAKAFLSSSFYLRSVPPTLAAHLARRVQLACTSFQSSESCRCFVNTLHAIRYTIPFRSLCPPSQAQSKE